ncbi:MAG: hypothetical protein GX112_10485 [Clostridiaceae bacterium]|nr:hypothetical protein [Clostridiaceae bacterium]
MWPEASWLTFLTVVTHLATLLLLALIGQTVILRGRHSMLRRIYIAIIGTLALWIVLVIWRLLALPTGLVWLFASLQALFVGAVSLCLTLFGMAYLGEQDIPARIILPLSLPLALAGLAVLTNPLHGGYALDLGAARDHPGPLYGVVQGINAAYVSLGLLLSCLGLRRQMGRHRLASALLVLAILLPLLPYGLSVSGVFRWAFEPEPLLLSFAVLCFGWAALRYHLLDIAPLARRAILHEIGSALAITDRSGRLIDFNPAFTLLCDPAVAVQPLMALDEACPMLAGLPGDRPLRREIQLETPSGPRLFDLTVQAVPGRQANAEGMVWCLADIGQEMGQRQLLARQHEQLETANQSLQKYVSIASELRSIQVRNQLAREMHDTTGHALIILMALLQRFQEERREGLLREARPLLDQILDNLSRPICNTEDSREKGELDTELQRLAHDMDVSGTRLEIDLRGPVDQIPSSHHPEIISICREALTNAVKHGQAVTVSLFLQAWPDRYELIILDDGRGADPIVKGFGLTNMEERVAALGGTLRTQSDSSGFGVYIAVPTPGDA